MSEPTTKKASFLDAFRALDERTKNILADIDAPLKLALATLMLAQDATDRDSLSLEHMVAALEAAGVAINRVKLARAMARAGSRVSRQVVSGEPYFKIMTKGRREVEQTLRAGSLNLVYIDGSTPRTSRQELSAILKPLSGCVRICDPYYGIRTLDTLELFRTSCVVRFLTAKTNEPIARLGGPLQDFKRERPSTEFRLYPKPSELHDRYILSRGGVLIVGHGLKDIGGRESFVISIGRALAPDLIRELVNSFDERWAKATPL